MSSLHFTSTEKYRERVIQLGEEPNRVFNVGAIGVENLKIDHLMTKNDLEKSINWNLDKPYALVTFHPVTLENESSSEQINQLLKAIDINGDLTYVFTKGNSDAHGRVINKMIDEFVLSHPNSIAFTSLGARRYLSAVKYCAMVIGNSSSGIIEVPSFGVPTINIGDRQKGRIQAKSVINCEPKSEEINLAIEKAKSSVFAKGLSNMINPYEKSNTASAIVSGIINAIENETLKVKKQFYDL